MLDLESNKKRGGGGTLAQPRNGFTDMSRPTGRIALGFHGVGQICLHVHLVQELWHCVGVFFTEAQLDCREGFPSRLPHRQLSILVVLSVNSERWVKELFLLASKPPQ